MNSYYSNDNDIKINNNKKKLQINKLKSQSSSEDCSVESEILTNEFNHKVTLNDGNSDDDSIQYSKEMFYNEKISKSTTIMMKSSIYTPQKARFVDECEYRMNNKYRGIALIINNKKFHPSLDMPVRTGTDKDAASLQKTFYKLGFNVQLEHNKTAYDMRDMLSKLGKLDHSDYDCFVCCILSHGEEGLIYGVDQSVEIEHLIAPFKSNRTLAGKPKLFFIQACRGTKLMDGIDTNPYKIQCVNKIPMEADFLIAYSTIAGFYSWRNSANGSWFIQSLCELLNANGNKLEIMQVLTAVNRKVAYHYESNASDPSMSGKRQIPCVVTMLTKELFFRPKQQICTDI
jgi:hypothetical protein